jgi:predicted HicB family RNase H-like nuclease
MKNPKIAVGLRITETDHEKIVYISKKNSRSLNNQIEFAVKKIIDQYEEENGEIKLSFSED